jgi:LPS-assembly lipoprotein
MKIEKRKHCAMLFLALFVAACGFRPLYQNTNTLTGQLTSLDQITIDQIAPGGQSAQALKNALIDRFYHQGYPQNAPYVLKIAIQETGRNIVIEKNDTTTRQQLVITANYDLTDRRTRKSIEHGIIRAVGAFDVLESQYTTLVTENSARDAAIKELADKIQLRLAVVLDKLQSQ